MMNHQQKQTEVINQIEQQVSGNNLNFSTVSTPKNEDYANDNRICLTSVHIPNKSLVEKIRTSLIDPLRKISPNYFYYSDDSLHITVKNVRVINDPPHFTNEDIEKAKKIFSDIVPNHKQFKVYFYRLILFPNNLALVGTTDEELDSIILDLDQRLKDAGLEDDKKYLNTKYFFCNMTLSRFSNYSNEFKREIERLSSILSFEPYTVDSVSLVTANAVFKKRNIIEAWNLK